MLNFVKSEPATLPVAQIIINKRITHT